MTTTREQLVCFLDQLLESSRFEDYGPNGLQIEGAERIERVAFAVSATVASARAAAAWQAQALVVHHGLFWSFQGARPLTGPFGRRIRTLVRHEINLLAYHLPLDAHPEIGNAATLAQRLGLVIEGPFGDFKGSPTGIRGRWPEPRTARAVQADLVEVLDHAVLMATPDPAALIERVGIITGGANREWSRALQEGLDGYITGEMSEHDWHESQEAGVHLFAGGHHATEQFGIQALMERVAQRLGVDCRFFNSENPA